METKVENLLNEYKESTLIEIAERAKEMLSDGIGYGKYISDLHNDLFNRDYYIIGNYRAEQWILKHFDSVFDAIRIVEDYEELVFGDIQSKFNSAEALCNMMVYIIGENVLTAVIPSDMDDKLLYDEELAIIIENLEKLIETLKN